MNDDKTKYSRHLLLIIFVHLGTFAIILQTILLREFIVVFSGNEMAVGLVFSSWLAGVTFGAFIGGKIAIKAKSGLFQFFAIYLTLAAASPILLYLVRGIRTYFEIPAAQLAPFFTLVKATLLIAAPAALPIGLIFPVAGVLADHLGIGKKSIGSLYSFEGAGATLGGVIFTFAMAGRLDSFHTLAIMIILSLCLTFLFLLLQGKKTSSIIIAAFTVAGIIFVVLGGVSLINQKSIERRWKSFAPNIEMIQTFDTRYQNIAVGKIAEQFSVYSNGEVLTSFPDTVEGIIEANLIACQHPHPKNVLILGAGAENLLSQLLANGIKKVDYVETDPKLMDLIFSYQSSSDLDPLNSSAVNRIATDGRLFVKNTSNKYDLVIVNFPDPSTAMLNRFYTKDFFKQLNSIMTPKGVVTLTITSAVNYVGDEVGVYVGSVYNTVKSVFPKILVLPEDTARIFASKAQGEISEDWTILKERYFERGLTEDGKFSPLIFKERLNPHRILKFRESLEGFETVGNNTDQRPVTFYFNLLLWDQFSTGQATPILSILHKTGKSSVVGFVIFVGLLMTLGLVFIRKRKPKTQRSIRVGWLIFTTGLSAMGLELVILLAFQNAHGALYEKIGLLVALFMGGLALGGGFITKKIGKTQINYNKYLLFSEGILISAAVLLGLATGVYLPSIIYYLFAIYVGVGAGIQFPLAASMAEPTGENIGKTAALIDWADHFGAFFGAALTGVFFIPIFGLMETCIIIAVLKTVGLISVWISR